MIFKWAWAKFQAACDFVHSSNRFFWSAFAGSAVITAAFAFAVGVNLGGEWATTAIDDLVEAGAALVATLACLLAGCRNRGRTRLGWLLIAGAAGSWFLGEMLWVVVEVGEGRKVPSPSLADAGFLGLVPLGIAGLLMFVAPRRRRWERARALADGLLIAVSLLFVSWELVLGPIFRTSHLSALAKLVTLLYPVGDVAMVSLVAFALSRGRQDSRDALVLLAAGILCLSVADTSFAYLQAIGSYSATVLDSGWVAGFLLISLASFRSDPSSDRLDPQGQPIGTVRMVIPMAVFAFALVAGIWVFATTGMLDTLGLAIGLGVAGLTLTSQLLTMFENNQLLERSVAGERLLRESQQALEDVITSVPVSLFAIDPDGTITLATGRGLDRVMSGQPVRTERLIGHQVRELLANLPEGLAAIDDALAGSASHFVASLPNGQLEVHLTPVLNGGRVLSVHGVAVDVTERREAEIAQRENEAKSRFLATMSHELRTPLNSVLGFAELLLGERRGPLNDRQRRYVVNITESGKHLLALINDVLDLSRVAAGQIEVSIHQVALEESIAEAVGTVRPLADRKGLKLVVECPPALGVMADSTRLRQVILNLLSNAIKFTPDRGRVSIRAARAEGQVSIAVEDSGIGIAPEHHERIFEEYSQVHADVGTGIRGTGLGLTVSRRLATLMGGSLSVLSQLGGGSTFTLRLPAAPAADRVSKARGMGIRGARVAPPSKRRNPAELNGHDGSGEPRTGTDVDVGRPAPAEAGNGSGELGPQRRPRPRRAP